MRQEFSGIFFLPMKPDSEQQRTEALYVCGTSETHQPKVRIMPNVYAGRRHFHLNIQFKRFSNDDEILD